MSNETTSPPDRPARRRVVIPRAWHQQLLERFVEQRDDPVAFARVGHCRLRDGSVEWLVCEFLPVRPSMAMGEHDLYMIVFIRKDGPGPVSWMESTLAQWPAEVIAAIYYNLRGPQPGQLSGFVREGDTIQPLDELFLPGAEMLRFPLRPVTGPVRAAGSVVDAGHVRYSRTTGAFGPGGVEALARMQSGPVAIYGGSRAALFVSEWGIRLGIPLLLCDPKPLKESHLGEISLLMGSEYVGLPKVEGFLRRVGEWGLATAPVEAFAVTAQSPDGVEAARRAAILIDACDTDSGSLTVSLLATIFHRPHLSIVSGVHFDGAGGRVLGTDVRLLLCGDRCASCLGNWTDYPGAVRELATLPPGKTTGSDAAWSDTRAGSLRSLNQAATALGQRLLEDLFLGRVTSSRWLRLLWLEDGRLETHELPVGPRDGRCAQCQKAGHGDAALGIF